MDWDTLRALDGDGVTIGAHTASHPDLTLLPDDEAQEEVTSCRATLERELGHPVRAFAYPFGLYNRNVVEAAGDCGFEFGVTIEPGRAQGTHPMLELPRLTVDGREPFDVFARLLA